MEGQFVIPVIFSILVLGIFGLIQEAEAIPEPFTIFNTGVDDSGTPLSLGSVDPHFVVVENGGSPAVVLDLQCTCWVNDSANSLWVWVTSDAFQNVDVTRTFKTTFDLTGFDPSTARIDGRIAVDNQLTGIILNGNPVPFPNAVFKPFRSFSITSEFQPGVNTLEFLAFDFGVIAGFNVQLSGTAEKETSGADLSLVKTFEPETISAGDTFTYFLTVKNNGPEEAENVVVEDELPSVAPLDTTFIDVTPGSPVCTFSAGKITCNLGNMALNEEKFIAIIVKTHDEATQGGFILNDATVKSDTEDSNSLNDKGIALIEIEIEGDLKLFAPDGSEILESNEEFPGGMVVVNDDNDNIDGSFDLNDVGNTINEDELVKLEVAKLTSPKGDLYLNGDFGTDKVSVYKNSDRTNKITSFPIEVEESDVFFVEGLKSSFLTEVNFELTPLNQPLESLDLVRLTVIKIESITFQGQENSATDTDTLDNNNHPSDASGLRVFPGARLDSATGMPGTARDTVTVVVTLSNQVPIDSGIDIFLKSFDVDDPTSNMMPLDDETLIADNRGFATIGPSSSLEGVLDGRDVNGISKLTFAKGEDAKTIDFKVSKQPGDNYRIAAHFDEDFVKSFRNDDTQNDGDKIFDDKSNKPLTNGISEVLTVWRFLHLELDTMMGPALATPIAADDDRFILPRTPDVSIVDSYLDDSYIVSKILGGSIDTSDNTLFDYHTTDAEASSTLPAHPCFEKRDFDKNLDEFWFVYLLSVFQGGTVPDYDPDGSGWELGYNPPLAGLDNTCILIYQENIRDLAANSNIVVASGLFGFQLEQATVIHELGHPLINQGGGDHATGLIMNNGWPEVFVDTNGNNMFDAGEPVNPIPTRFADTALNFIRSGDRPGS